MSLSSKPEKARLSDEGEAGPERTCAGCRQKAVKEELERFVYLEPGGLVFDLRQKAPGRGIWVHPSGDCLEKAVRGGFSRALKRRVEVDDVEGLRAQVVAGLERRQSEALGDALRSGGGVVGQMLVQEAMKRDQVVLLLIAADVGESTEKKFLSNADRKDLPVLRNWSGSYLGRMTGREFVSVIGITAERHGQRLWRDDERRREIGGKDG